jgi:glycosyltransferase involved in cell wall biosynthesis
VKVLHVLEAIEGGTSRHLRYLVKYVKADHIVVVPPERVGGLTDESAYDALEAAGAEVHVVPMRRSPVSTHNATALAHIRRLIRQRRPAVVHGHSSIGGALARVAAVGTGKPCVYTPNGLFPWLSAMAVERALGRYTDLLIASSQSEAQLVQQLRLVPAERMVVIPNAIELDDPPPAPFDVRARLGVPQSTPIVGSVARLVPQKAPEVFVRACGLVAQRDLQTRFVLVGDGPQVEMVEAEIERAGLADRFLLLQHCYDGPSLMKQFDIFVLSSRYEASAYAPLEAMRAGAAIVVTDVVGNRDAIDHERTGLIAPPEDPDALADCVGALLSDEGLRREMAEAARRRLVQRYDMERVADQVLEAYEQVAGVRRQPSLEVVPSIDLTETSMNDARRLAIISQRKRESTYPRAAVMSASAAASELSSSTTA